MASISHRAFAVIAPSETMKLLGQVFSNQYDKENNPDGVVCMWIAENKLMYTLPPSHLMKILTLKPADPNLPSK